MKISMVTQSENGILSQILGCAQFQKLKFSNFLRKDLIDDIYQFGDTYTFFPENFEFRIVAFLIFNL